MKQIACVTWRRAQDGRWEAILEGGTATWPGQERAMAPHCDSAVLHAPGECEYCDHYPDFQAYRTLAGINFTGHHNPQLASCPAEARRPQELIEEWSGNVPMTPERRAEHEAASARVNDDGWMPTPEWS